jgi:hypothetical protein
MKTTCYKQNRPKLVILRMSEEEETKIEK